MQVLLLKAGASRGHEVYLRRRADGSGGGWARGCQGPHSPQQQVGCGERRQLPGCSRVRDGVANLQISSAVCLTRLTDLVEAWQASLVRHAAALPLPAVLVRLVL